jgi:nitrate reductase gamma subunit
MRQQSIRERQSLISEINIQQHQREIATFQLYASCLGAAAVLDIILGTLLTTSRRRLRGEVDRAIVFGVCCNLVLLLVAVTSMLSRREKLSWLHRGVVCTVAVAMVVGDALLLLRAVSS